MTGALRSERVGPFVALFGLNILTTFTMGLVPPLLPLLAADWSLMTVEIGLINTIYAVGRLAASYPASLLRASWGTRCTALLGLSGLAAGLLVCGVAPTFSVLLAGRLLMGLGGSAAFLAVFADLLDRAPLAWRGRLANAFDGTAILAETGGVLVAGLAGTIGWRTVFIGSAPVLLLSLLAWRALGPVAGHRGEVSGRRVSWHATRFGSLVPVYIAGFAMTFTWIGVSSTLVPLLGHGRYGLSPSALSFSLSAGYAAELVGLLGLGLVIDRIRREPAFLAGALSVGAGGLVLALGIHASAFVVGLVLVGGGFAVWMIPATLLADRAGTPLAPGYLAVFRLVMDAGMIAGPVVLTGLAQAAGEPVAIGTAGAVLIAAALTLRWR